MGYEYVNITVINCHTSANTSFGCKGGRVFHGYVPNKFHDLNMGVHAKKPSTPKSQIAHELLEQTVLILQYVHNNPMQTYVKCEAYNDKNTNASELKEHKMVYVLQQRADH